MALNLAIFISVNQTNSQGYDVGDVIEVFYNDTTDSFQVDVNSSTETSGGDIPSSLSHFPLGGGEDSAFVFTVVVYGYQFCLDGNLNTFQFQESFPYCFRDSFPDESCSAVICDLVKGSISIVSATGAGVSDGSITVTASSSNEVRFDTDDRNRFTQMPVATDNGDGSYTYTFSNYPPGTYSIHAKDSEGCRASWSNVVIGINEGVANYGVLQRWGYYNKEGLEHRVDLLQKGYSGSVTERDLMDSTPTIRSVRGENAARTEVIFPGSMEVNVMSETDKEYLELMRTSSDNDLLINFYIKPSSTYDLVFRGFVTTTLYTEPYKGGDYVSTLSANDRLGDLSKIDISDDSGNPLYGDISVFEVLRTCLNKTGLDLDYRIAMNLYEANMDSDASDDPLTQVYVNSDSYYTDGVPMNCYDVLKEVLKSINCEIRSYGGYWYIIYKPEKYTTYDYREFDNEGNYVTNSSISPQVDLKAATETDRATLLPWPSLQGDDVYKNISVNSIIKLKQSIVAPFDERTLNDDSYSGWSKALNGDTGSIVPVYNPEFQSIIIQQSRNGDTTPVRSGSRLVSFTRDRYYYKFAFSDDQGGNAYIIAGGSIEYSGNDTFLLKIPVLFSFQYRSYLLPYVKLKYSLKVGSKYLDSNGAWTASETINEYFLETVNKEVEIEIIGTFDETITVNTTTTFELRIYDIDPFEYNEEGSNIVNLFIAVGSNDPTLLEGGSRIVGRITGTNTLVYFEVGTDGTSNIWDAVDTRTISSVGSSSAFFRSITFLTYPNGVQIPDVDVLEINTTTGNVIDLEYEVSHFDLNTTINNSENLVTNYFKLEDGTPTSAWGDSGKKIQRIHGEQISGWYSQMAYRISGEITTDLHLTPYNVFREIADGNRIYTPVSMDIDDKRMKARVEMVELYSDDTVTPSAFTSGFKQNAFR